jgi:hypothetical protein
MPELEVGRPAPPLEGIAAKKASVAAPPPFHALLTNPKRSPENVDELIG